MKESLKLLIVGLPVLIIGVFALYYFSSKDEINSADQACKADEDCIMTMVECSCDCGVPINKIHWQKYLDAQEERCKNYDGSYCKMNCAFKPKCINNMCTVKLE